jgi:hypothetical protein
MKDSQHTSTLLMNVPKFLKSTPLPSLTQLAAGCKSSNKLEYDAQSCILTCMPYIPCILFNVFRLQWTSSTAWGSAGGQGIPQALQQGAAATLSDRDKYRAHTGRLHPGHTFVLAGVETYGHLGSPTMRYLRTLSDIASTRSLAVTRGSFLARAHRELSVALVQSQGVYHCALCAVSCWGFRASSVAWSGHSLP